VVCPVGKNKLHLCLGALCRVAREQQSGRSNTEDAVGDEHVAVVSKVPVHTHALCNGYKGISVITNCETQFLSKTISEILII
jgi:hypothetical protein